MLFLLEDMFHYQLFIIVVMNLTPLFYQAVNEHIDKNDYAVVTAKESRKQETQEAAVAEAQATAQAEAQAELIMMESRTIISI